ncbi:MAG: Protein-glutamate O-methyltransferase [Proteobacteria bacterium]|nr:Protein-glutamate O-methyltransferase [Pseudomonadota bacterium]
MKKMAKKRSPAKTEQDPAPHDQDEPIAAQADPGDSPLMVERRFIVAIGASAGGLEALTALASSLPTDLNVPFIVLQHLSPNYRSMMVQLLSRTTELEVREIEDGAIPLPNRIYITPPNRNLILENERFRLIEPGIEVLPKPSVNTFFHSLAESRGEDAIAIVLSGTGSDGASGARAIKAGGGLVFAQDPLSAKYSGMPQSTIDTGCADWVLSPGEIARELTLIVKSQGAVLQVEQPAASPTTLKALLYKVQRHSQVDFSGYKEATVWRRILRRMAANRVNEIDEYINLAEKNPEEYNQLCKEILISVTAFFRDPQAFESLRSHLKERLAQKVPGEEVRIWVPGCATGEEAYTIAILLFELLGERRYETKLQIFATDLDLAAMANARRGVYSESSLSAMPPELVARYFHPQGDAYEVIKPLREAVVFARQNVLQDPPFLRLDMISCRNLLIYFQNTPQEKVLDTFHYALAPGGLLFLGKSESVYQRENLFDPIEREHKLFRRRELASGAPSFVPLSIDMSALSRSPARRQRSIEERFAEAAFGAYVPPSVMVNSQLDVLHVFGDVSQFLKIPAGKLDFNLLNLIGRPWRTEVQTLVHQMQHKRSAVSGRIHAGEAGKPATRLVIHPVPGEYGELAAIVSFEPVPETVSSETTDSQNPSGLPSQEIEEELVATREHLQTVIEELETANEETQALNEELQAANEELQAANEELQASNEELQSTNEELTTVNEELQVKTAELADANADLESIQNSLDSAILVVSDQFRVLRFNESASRLLDLNYSRIGHSVRDVFAGHPLNAVVDIIDQVIRLRQSAERTIEHAGRHFVLRGVARQVRPGDNHGCVISLTDETALVEAQRLTRESQQRLAAFMEHAAISMAVKDTAGRYEFFNPRFLALVESCSGSAVGQITGRTDAQIFDTHIAARFRARDIEVMRKNAPIQENEQLAMSDGTHNFLTVHFPLVDEQGTLFAVGTLMNDITGYHLLLADENI